MPIEAVQTRMRVAFPTETDAATVRAIRDGIAVADDVIASAPALNTMIGQDYRGLVRRAGVMFALHEACRSGILPFVATIRRMPRGHWHYLEIASGNERAHICRTEEPGAFPVDTPVKQDERLQNNFDLFEKLPPTDVLLSSIPRLHVWLAFGADARGNLTHACWAVPAKTEKEWLAYENILRPAFDESGVAPTSTSPTPDPRKKLRFKQHIEAALEEKNDEKSA